MIFASIGMLVKAASNLSAIICILLVASPPALEVPRSLEVQKDLSLENPLLMKFFFVFYTVL